MSTCYEYLRKPQTNTNTKSFFRLKSYFDALQNDQTELYHKNHGRG